ncbi:MAG: hypothetical protein ACC682_15510, partial [Gemmatimonadota bacterium]
HAQVVSGASGGVTSGGALFHNPVFGLGPQTIWKGGFGFELEGELTRGRGQLTRGGGQLDQERMALHAEFTYGVTADVSLTLAVPVLVRRTESGIAPGGGQIERDATGVGDAVLRAKWRIFHKFNGPTQYHAALIGGVKLPVASSGSSPSLGSGSTDYIGGATISRDGLRYYLWTSALVKVNGEAFSRRRGNEFRYDAAIGVRPWIPKYTGVDPLLLLEFNGVTVAQNVLDDTRQAETGGTILALSPGFWLTRRNIALKGGVKIPFFQDLGADEPEFRYTIVFAFEIHV